MKYNEILKQEPICKKCKIQCEDRKLPVVFCTDYKERQ